MRNSIAYPTQQSSSPSRGVPSSHKRGNDRVKGYNCFTRNGGSAIPKHVGPEAKGSNPTTGLTLLWAHNPFREILTIGKSHGQKESCQTFEETSGYVTPERINKWSKSMRVI